jgi:sugar phosphate permease
VAEKAIAQGSALSTQHSALVNWLARLGLHYGWVVVAVTFPTVLVAAGLRAAPAVLIRPWEAEFGWDRAAIGLMIAINLVLYGAASPISGRLIDKFGPRRIALVSVVVATVGTVCGLFVRELWQLYLVWGVAVGLGCGGVAMVLSATVANRWFVGKRGLVTGILGAGTSAGQLVFVPSMMALTVTEGWRAGVMLFAGLLGVVILPLLFLLFRNSPADVGLRPFGAAPQAAGGPAGAAGEAPAYTLGQAVRTVDFWLLAGSYFICGYTTNGLIGTHLIPHAIDHGIPEVATAGVIGLMGMMNVLGTIASGMLTDRYDPRRLLAVYYFFRGMSLFLLPFIQDVRLLAVFAVLYGLDWLATVPPTVALTGDRFGRASLGSIFGWIFLSHQLGGATASYLAGALYVAQGNYYAAFISAGVTAVIAAGLGFGVRRPHAAKPAPAAA